MWSPRALAPLSFIGLVIYPFWVPLYPIEFSISQRENGNYSMDNGLKSEQDGWMWFHLTAGKDLVNFNLIIFRELYCHQGSADSRSCRLYTQENTRRGNEYSISLLELYENFLRMLFVLYSFWVSWILAHNVFDLLTSSTFQLWGWQVIQKSVTKSPWSNI